MALERFIPKSPDANIRNGQDFEVAKFGHLNTIVEYINSYVVADGLQLSGTGPLSTTLRAITDNIGNTSKLLLSTTSTAVFNDFRFLGAISGYVALEAPNSVTTYTLKLPSTTGSAGQAIITDGSGNLSFGTVTTNPSGVSGAIQFSNGSAFASDASNLFWDNTNKRLGIGTNTPTQPLSVNGQILSINGRVSTGTTWIDYDGTFRSQWGWLKLSSSGDIRLLNNASIGGDFVPTATTHIKGSGSTGATTSLLVQNSAATESFKVTDDGTVWVKQTIGFLTNPYFNFITSNFGGVTFDNDGVGAVRCSYTNGRYQCNDRIGFGAVNSAVSRVLVVGTGSTSATTSLLVQNSGGATALQVKDDLTATFGGNISASNLILPNGAAIFAGTQLRIGAGAITILSDSANAINFGAGVSGRSFGISSATSGGPNSTAFLFVGDTATGVTMGSNSNSHASAVLDLVSTTRGFLPPRMTTAQKNAIATPAAGLVVYDTDLNKLCVYTTAWQTITSA